MNTQNFTSNGTQALLDNYKNYCGDTTGNTSNMLVHVNSPIAFTRKLAH